MAIGVILAQSRPANTNAASVYSPGSGVQAEITQILVCNTTSNTPTYRIFLDNDGSTFDETTALYFDNAMAANSTEELIQHGSWWITDPSGNLGVRSSAANEITFTFFGVEHGG